jgi:hypothetical protein
MQILTLKRAPDPYYCPRPIDANAGEFEVSASSPAGAWITRTAVLPVFPSPAFIVVSAIRSASQDSINPWVLRNISVDIRTMS